MPALVNLPSLIDDARCFELVRQHRWPDGVRCPRCGGAAIARDGRDEGQPAAVAKRSHAGGWRLGLVGRGRHRTAWRRPMPTDHPATTPQAAGRADDAKLFASLELSKSRWLVTVSAPGSEKLSKHAVSGGDGGALLDLLARPRAP